MSKVQMLRALVKQRLTAAAEEIFGLFERTIAEYEEELCRSKEENERQRKLLDAVFQPRLRLRRADVQQLMVEDEDPPEQQDWRPSLDQEDPPEPPHIKEEQEELWTNQEGEQLGGLEEADISKFTLSVPVKSEDDDEEKPQSSQLHQRQSEETDADGEDCGGPGPARNSDPGRPDTEDTSEPEPEGSDEDWKEAREPRSGLKVQKKNEMAVSHMTRGRGEKAFLLHSCSECGKGFSNRTNLKVHMRIHTGEKPFNCIVCGRIFTEGGSLREHMAVHSGKKRLKCQVCEKRFTLYNRFMNHQCVGRLSSRLRRRLKNTSLHSFIKTKPSGSAERWEQELVERTEEDQDQPGTPAGPGPHGCST